MSLNFTGPDRKKIKLTSSHVSHLLINNHRLTENSARHSLDPRSLFVKAARNSFHVISFCFSFACILIFLSFCLHAYTISILDYADLMAIRTEKGKLGKVSTLARTFCFFWWFDDVKVGRTILMPVGGGVRVFVLSIIESFSIVTADTSRISRFLRSIFDLFARAGKGFSVHAFQLKSLLKV